MCVLRVSGKKLDPDACLARSKLKAIGSWKRGELRRRGGKNSDSGFTVSVSDADWDAIDPQAKDASRFLLRHRRELLRLSRSAAVDLMTLDFPLELRIGRGAGRKRIATQSDYLPPLLIERAGELSIGIEISIYPTSHS